MAINLNTGVINNSTTSMVTLGGKKADTQPVEPIIFPNNGVPIITVEPNTMAVLTAYDIGCEPVRVQKVLLSAGIPERAVSCGCTVVSDGGVESIILHAINIPSYEMTKDNPISVITIPGKYAITYDDTADDDAPDVVVTRVVHALQIHGPQLPHYECECNTCDPRGSSDPRRGG